jgi:serine/threonine protein kinase/lipopolysaccharide biosynthesis regulator YciM
LLGLDPEQVGDATAKASFAKALTERCVDDDQLEALVDVILVSKPAVDPRVRDIATLLGKQELSGKVGPFSIVRKLGESELSFVYLARRSDDPLSNQECVLKVLKRDLTRDRRAVQRFLTANRLVASVRHAGLPQNITAGELSPGQYYVAYDYVDAQPLSVRFARTGPSHMNELRPILRGILEPLAALHKAHLTHGDLKMENVLVGRAGEDGNPRITLIDFGTDRLRQRPHAVNGHTGVLAVFGSPKTVAPEIVRGRNADAASDVYAFACIMYELLSGKPVFPSDSAADAAFAHLMKDAEPPSTRAPRGWVSKEVDDFVLSLLNKDPARRPRDASALLDAIDALGRMSGAAASGVAFPEERLTDLIDTLIASPEDTDAAIALEKAVEEGADPVKVAEAFDVAADGMSTEGDGLETKKALLYRAARIFDTQAKDKTRAEKVYKELVELDPSDEIAQIALEDIRKQLGKYDEVVEMLVGRSEAAESGEERARIFAEIGRLCAYELDDPAQGLVAMTQALCEMPTNDEYASEIEKLAGNEQAHWGEVLSAVTEAIKGTGLSASDKNALLAHAGRWYDQKIGRADTALMAFQQILKSDPANETANEGLAVIYRRAQQWPELAAILLARADAAGPSPRGRDLRADAAEIFESKLNDAARAKDIYAGVLAEDPGHTKAGDALTALAERMGDFQTLVGLLERRSEAKRGPERVEALLRVAEAYEDHLNDLGEATRRYESVLALDATNLVALKGLDRIFNRTGKYRELLENLERQVQLAATPRQKINLYERMASLHDEEFLDHAAAAQALEAILALDPSNDAALTALARHYRALGKWEDLVRLYDAHANATGDDARRVDLLVSKARALADQIGSPERAMRAYEQVLEHVPGHAGALEELARLRELTGDADAALSAIEALAGKATTPEQKAEQWVRAARLLEGRGDKDGAIERYKLALEVSPKDAVASAALRQAYTQRGEIQGLVTIIEQDLVHADGPTVKARLYAELARVYREKLRDMGKAEVAAREAVGFDATNAEALIVLGDLAFEDQRYLEATKNYETLIGRAASLPRADAIRILVRFIEAFGKTAAGRPSSPSLPVSTRDVSTARTSLVVPLNPRVTTAVDALKELGPHEPDVLVRVARVVFDQGDAAMAREMYGDLLADYGERLSLTERADALYRHGEATRRTGDLESAVAPLQEAAAADPGNPAPLTALARVYEEKGDWESVLRVKRRRLEVAAGAERFDLLLEIGDIEFLKIGDRARAAKTYVTALEERPDDRKLLTKLMQVYSEDKDWGKLVDVVLRLADFVEDPKQRAKYMHTAAIVSSRQLGAMEQALQFYDKVLEFDPTLTKALDEAIEIRRSRGDHEALERLLKMKLEQAKASQDRDTMVAVLDELADLYRKFLNEPDLAVDAYEAAQAFDPEGRERGEVLAELYASDVGQYLDKAVRAQAQMLRKNPYRVEGYKLLRKLYTEGQRADASWCLCQTLSVLNLAEPDEERFYKRHRADNAAPAQATLEDADWDKLLGHWDIDPLVTRIFALIQPTILRMRTQPVEAHGYDMRYALDPSLHPYPVSQTLFYVQGVLGFGAPLIFQNANDAGGLGFLHAQTPALIIGRAALEAQVPNQSAAFIAGRHVTYFRPGYYVRQLVSNPTSLKAWLFAAIKLCVPQFPVAPDVQGEIAEAMAGLQEDFQGSQREKLGAMVSRLIQSGGAIDLKKWVAAVDYTADRAGFLLAHDLGVATDVMRATEDAASVPVKERMKELVLFSSSEEYIWLRQKLGISIEG